MPAPISDYVPQFVTGEEASRQRRAARAVWCVSLTAVLLFVGVIVLAPLTRAHGQALLSWGIYRAFSVACHQMPERSFFVGGFPLAVCARCFGLYAGGAAGVLVFPLLRPLSGAAQSPPRMWLFLAAVPTTIDFALGFFGFWENTHLSRFATASLLGMASAFYVVPGLLDLGRSYLAPRVGRARRVSRRGTLEV
ncbi:MAG TPA: DUF2085 domain-containing protein [Pyrinomonadaceae bacterium]|nr:DUF2085 domain-containing protein [Pyrinomonadaceae bacterium]